MKERAMTETIVLRGHPGVGPDAEGVALVCDEGFSARYDYDRYRGVSSAGRRTRSMPAVDHRKNRRISHVQGGCGHVLDDAGYGGAGHLPGGIHLRTHQSR